MEEDGERNGLARVPGITRSRDSGEQALREPHSRERLRWSLGSAPRGLCPSPRRAGRGKKTTQAPHDGGPPACKDKTDVLLPDCPARRGWTPRTSSTRSSTQCRPRADGALPRTSSPDRETKSVSPRGRGSARRRQAPGTLTSGVPARTGAQPPGPAPGVRTPSRDTQPPGAMRNLRVPENTHSGDW